MQLITVILSLLALLTGTPSNGWTPAPTPPFDQAAGVTCDFPIHGQAIVDHVVTKVLTKYPDGSIKRDAFQGALIVRLTDTLTGSYYDADASGSAVVDHDPSGAQTWYVVGPVLAGFRQGKGNLPRGMYILDGLYRLQISSAGFATFTAAGGHADNICGRIG